MLKTRLLACGVFAVLLAGRYGMTYPAAPPDAAALQGTWLITAVERNGKPDSWQVGGMITFAGNTATFQRPSVLPITYTVLDAAALNRIEMASFG